MFNIRKFRVKQFSKETERDPAIVIDGMKDANLSEAECLNAEINDLRQKIEIEKQNAENCREKIQKLTASIEKLKNARDQLVERSHKNKDLIDKLRPRAQMFARNMALNRYLAFAQQIESMSSDCQADVYVAHGVQALPAADRLRDLNGGYCACDAIEIPSFAQRALPSGWDMSVLRIIDHAFLGYVREADFLVTVGWALADLLSSEHPDIRVVPNYRKYEEYPVNTRIRDEFGIPHTAPLVLCISKIASGFEDVLRALSMMDESVHLVTVGSFVPETYREEIESLRDTLNLQDRVHFRGNVPYKELGAFCLGADVGLIVRDPSIPNNHISLPNRVFDYLASNLPIVSPMMPDIHRIISEYKCGVTINEITPAAWAEGIRQALVQKGAMRENAAVAAAALTWESLEQDSLHKAFNSTNSVTFVGFNNLAQNNRTMRMAASLASQGVRVKIASPMEETDVLPDGVIPIKMQKA